MSFERITLNEILEDGEILQGLREAVQRRLAFSDETEHEKVHALTNRAMHPECSFDRKHRLMLCALALAAFEAGRRARRGGSRPARKDDPGDEDVTAL